MLSYKIIRFNGEKSSRIRGYRKNFTNKETKSRYYSESGGGISKSVSKRAEIFINNMYKLPIFRNQSKTVYTMRDLNILIDIAVDMFQHNLDLGLERIGGNYREMLKAINEINLGVGQQPIEDETEITDEQAELELSDEELELKDDEKEDYISVYESAMILARYMFTFLFNTSLSMIMSRVVRKRYKKPLNVVLTNAGTNTKRNLYKLFFVAIRNIMNTSGLSRFKKSIEKEYPGIFTNQVQDMARVLAAQAISSIVSDYGEFRSVTSISVAKYASAINDYTKLIDLVIRTRCMERLERLSLSGNEQTPSEMSEVEFAREFRKIRPGMRAYRIADKLLKSKGPKYFSRPERVTESLLRLFSKYFSEEELEQIEDEINVTIKRAEAQELVSNLRDLVAKLSELLLGEAEVAQRYTVDTGEEVEESEEQEVEDTADEDTEDTEDVEEIEEVEETDEEDTVEEGEEEESEEEGEGEEEGEEESEGEEGGEEEGKYYRRRRLYSEEEDEEEDEEDDDDDDDETEESKYYRARQLFSKRPKKLRRKTRVVKRQSMEKPVNFFEVDKTDKFLRRLGLPKRPKK